MNGAAPGCRCWLVRPDKCDSCELAELRAEKRVLPPFLESDSEQRRIERKLEDLERRVDVAYDMATHFAANSTWMKDTCAVNNAFEAICTMLRAGVERYER